MYSKELIKGTLQPIILKLLEDNGRMYGYEITQKVKELTKDKIELTEGALYPTLHKLELEGVVKVEQEFIGKRLRKYYKLTKSGSKEVVSRTQDVRDFLKSMQLIFEPKIAK